MRRDSRAPGAAGRRGHAGYPAPPRGCACARHRRYPPTDAGAGAGVGARVAAGADVGAAPRAGAGAASGAGASFLGYAAPALAIALAVNTVAADPNAWVAQGDEAYARGRMYEAIAAYRGALQESPRHLGALCRLVRAESEQAEDTTGQASRRLAVDAVEHARAAVDAVPDSALGHAWLATALGGQARHEGPRSRLALAREIKSEADRAIGLDPGSARAYHARGAWNRWVARLSFMERAAAGAVLGGVPKGASLDNAVADFEKAVALDPNQVDHRLELARTYHLVHRDADARRELDHANALPLAGGAHDLRDREEARKLLARLPRTP